MAKSEYKRDEVENILNSVLMKVGKNGSKQSTDIGTEIKDLANIIQKTRAELIQARPHDINQEFIPTATDELDEVVEETATATDKIMDQCDALQALDIPSPYKEQVGEKVTQIFEACSFQDITGQRIRKVVKTLQDIEEKIKKLTDMLGIETDPAATPYVDGREGDEALLNGPQQSGEGVSQEDIDKLLADFD